MLVSLIEALSTTFLEKGEAQGAADHIHLNLNRVPTRVWWCRGA